MRYPMLIAVALGATACSDGPTSPMTTVSGRAASSVATLVPRIEFQGFICFGVTTVQGNEWISHGGVYHFRNGENLNRWVTGNPLVDGVEHNVADENLNLKNGTGTIHLDLSVKPDAVDGTWEIRQTVQFRDFEVVDTRGVGHGTGELHGLTLKFTAEGAAPIPGACGTEGGFGPAIQGVILGPAVQD